MKKKISLILATVLLFATMIGLIVGLVGCDKNDPGEETQNPFQSVRSPETTKKPDISDAGANTEGGYGGIKTK